MYMIIIQEKMDLHVLSCNTNLLENGVNNMGIQIYNKMSVSIKMLNKYKIFKRNLKFSLINHAFYSVD